MINQKRKAKKAQIKDLQRDYSRLELKLKKWETEDGVLHVPLKYLMQKTNILFGIRKLRRSLEVINESI